MTDFDTFKQRFGPMLIWAQAVDRANRRLREGDHVVVGWFNRPEAELLHRACECARNRVPFVRRQEFTEASKLADELTRTESMLAKAIAIRLKLPAGVEPAIFPFDREWIYLPRAIAVAARVPFTEREQLRDFPEDMLPRNPTVEQKE